MPAAATAHHYFSSYACVRCLQGDSATLRYAVYDALEQRRLYSGTLPLTPGAQLTWWAALDGVLGVASRLATVCRRASATACATRSAQGMMQLL